MCVMKISYNHTLIFSDYNFYYRSQESARKLGFVLSNIYQQSPLAESEIFRLGDELPTLYLGNKSVKIGKECDNIKQFKELIIEAYKRKDSSVSKTIKASGFR